MERTARSPSTLALGAISIILGVLGLGLYWWNPLGMVLSLSSLLTAFVGWVSRQRRTAAGTALLIIATVLGIAALGIDLWAVWANADTIRFTALR
jgi:hypothetical protein